MNFSGDRVGPRAEAEPRVEREVRNGGLSGGPWAQPFAG